MEYYYLFDQLIRQRWLTVAGKFTFLTGPLGGAHLGGGAATAAARRFCQIVVGCEELARRKPT
jgi:hypothetical protein